MAQHFASQLVQKQLIPSEDQDIYSYGAEVLFSTIANVLLGLAISLVWGQLMAGMIFMGTFALLRKQTGGFHASTHVGCIITFSAILSTAHVILYFVSVDYLKYVSIVLVLLANVIIIKLTPVEHLNKPIPQEKIVFHRRMSILIALTLTGFCILGTLFTPNLVIEVSSCALALFSVSMSMAVATLHKKKERRQLNYGQE